MAVLLLSVIAIAACSTGSSKKVVVNPGGGVALYQSADSSVRIGSLPPKAKADVLQEQGAWFQIRPESDPALKGWVLKAQTQPAEGPPDSSLLGDVLAALITGAATIIAALIGREYGHRQGRRHSLLRFMDEQGGQLSRAMEAIADRDSDRVVALSQAIVDNVDIWRRIQQNFLRLLNGRIDSLAKTLRTDAPDVTALEADLRALHEGYAARRLAVETELEKSSV